MGGGSSMDTSDTAGSPPPKVSGVPENALLELSRAVPKTLP